MWLAPTCVILSMTATSCSTSGDTVFRHVDESEKVGSNEAFGELNGWALSTAALPWQRQIRIPLIGTSLPDGRQYSRWRCVGGLEDDYLIFGQQRTCVFRNICYNQSDWLFYQRPGERLPILFDHKAGMRYGFRQRHTRAGHNIDHDFVALWWKPRPWERYDLRWLSWSPLIVEDPLPKRHVALQGLHALIDAPFAYAANLGHFVWEIAFPLFVAMAQLGEYTRHLRVIQRSDFCRTDLCHKFADAFLRPLLGVHEEAIPALADLATALGQSTEPLCFDRLLVGATAAAFDSEARNEGKEPLLMLYRARVLEWHQVSMIPLASHRIVLVDKQQGKRGIKNFDEVYEEVLSSFHAIANVTRVILPVLSIMEQLHLLSRTTVAVSPCGGVSMILPFLPESAFAILINYALDTVPAKQPDDRHGECAFCSWTMEGEFWRHVPHIRKLYYQVFGPDDFEGRQMGRDSRVIVNASRIRWLIQAAFEEMQPY
mmetsp:Transcript_25378/g.70624  ORF Transcript_25378/g.70624 Transcript_25378/m.70624 type:complete len:486 (+) Transcript_25378:215-1672(+)